MSEFGFLNLTVHSASLHPSLKESGIVWIDTTLSNISALQTTHTSGGGRDNEKQLDIRRRTSDRDGYGDLIWNESFETRCKVGWEFQPRLTILHNDGSGAYTTLFADRITIGPATCGSLTCYLRTDTGVLGEVVLSLDYYPNHQSFLYVVGECLLETSEGSDPGTGSVELESFIPSVLAELQERALASSSILNETTADNISNAAGHIASVIDNNSEMDGLIHSFIPHNASLAPKDRHGGLSSPGSGSGRGVRERSIARARIPNLVRQLNEHFFREISESESGALSIPSFNSFLIEKLISLLTVFGISGSDDGYLSWAQVRCFLKAVAAWAVQHAFAAAALCADLRISMVELSAIRERFVHYDSNLSGEMDSSEVTYLLMDMGTEYTADEIEVVLTTIDPDGLGVVDFGDILRWWVGLGTNPGVLGAHGQQGQGYGYGYGQGQGQGHGQSPKGHPYSKSLSAADRAALSARTIVVNGSPGPSGRPN